MKINACGRLLLHWHNDFLFFLVFLLFVLSNLRRAPCTYTAVHFDFCRWACVFLAVYGRLSFVISILVFLY